MRRHTPNDGLVRARRGGAGYTLIEMLVVIGVIGILAAMIFPITKAITRNRIRTKTRAELQLLQSAIESYKAKLGHYPPDNGTNHLVNQLYYELVGATYAKNANNTPNTGAFQTSDGNSVLVSAFVFALGQPNSLHLVNTNPVTGLVNFIPQVDNEEGSTVVNFLKGFNPAQFQTDAAPPGGTGLRFLVSTIPWPATTVTFPAYSGYVNRYCAWRYNSYNPPNNPGAFDLWVDVLIDGKTNRICNWSRDPIIVTTPDE